MSSIFLVAPFSLFGVLILSVQIKLKYNGISSTMTDVPPPKQVNVAVKDPRRLPTTPAQLGKTPFISFLKTIVAYCVSF